MTMMTIKDSQRRAKVGLQLRDATSSLLLLLLLHGLVWACSAEAAKIKYSLTAAYGLLSPDCVERQVSLFNGQQPGPTITGTEGDVLEITVHNQMAMESLTVHWHGIRQLGNNFNDGTAFVNQCPIGPLQSHTYTFFLDKAGTYMYHGHLGLDTAAGLNGMLVVYDKGRGSTGEASGSSFPAYDDELMLMLNDWYHLTPPEQAAVLGSNQWVNGPQSLLLNGRGRYNCSFIPTAPGSSFITGDAKQCDQAAPQCARAVLEVEPGKTYRLRIASIAALASLNLAIEGHGVTVLAADAYAVQGFGVGSEGLDVYVGQTVDVLLKADQKVGNYWIRSALFGLPYDTPYGLAVLRYKGAAPKDPETRVPRLTRNISDTAGPYAQAVKYKARTVGAPWQGDVPVVGPARKGSQPLVLSADLLEFDNQSLIFINNVSLGLPSTPYSLGLAQGEGNRLYQRIPLSNSWSQKPRVAPAYYNFPHNKLIDIVLQNHGFFGGPSENHPWHMHGHHFWVLAYGNGTFDASKDAGRLNLVDPPYRYTVPMLANGLEPSWTAIRLKADNPGAWLFHCHVDYHLYTGMAVVFVDGFVPPVPKGTQRCGF